MITDQIILITGASRGIGFAAAKQLASRGAKLWIASREYAQAERAASEIGKATTALQLDITNINSVRLAVSEITQHHGRLDVLVNNSAILLDHYECISSLDPERIRQTFETNLFGTLRITQALLPLLEKSATPRIINVSSRAGQFNGEPQSWAPAYSMSKAALNMLTLQLSAALPNILVNSMCPGWCRTEMGGADAPLSADEGADTLVWLALDAPNELRGNFIKKREVVPW